MQKLKFIYQNWNREYYELQSEEDTCSYYKNFYKGKEFKILPQILAENTKNTEKWAKYAYEQNKYFNLFSKITVPISVNLIIFSIGISTESKKIEKLILKNNHKDIVIIIENWEILSSEVQDFIIVLLKNKERFIKQYSKNSITIVYGTTNTNDKLNNSFFDNIIEYGNLSLKDSFLLIQQYTDFNDIDYKLFEEN